MKICNDCSTGSWMTRNSGLDYFVNIIYVLKVYICLCLYIIVSMARKTKTHVISSNKYQFTVQGSLVHTIIFSGKIKCQLSWIQLVIQVSMVSTLACCCVFLRARHGWVRWGKVSHLGVIDAWTMTFTAFFVDSLYLWF